jgi:adenylate cyclase
MLKLLVQNPVGNRHPFEWDGDELTIGRGVDAVLRLEDGHASRLHARLHREAGHYVITDLNSGNGLYVNDERVSSRVLAEGDVIRVGRSRIVVESAEGSAQGLRFSESDTDEGTVLVRRVEDPAGTEEPKSTRAGAPDVELLVLRKKARILQLMFELGNTLKGSVSLEAVYRQVSELLLEVCAPDRVLILECADSADGLRLAYRGIAATRGEFFSRNRTISRTITRKVIAERVTLLSSNASVDPALAHGQSIVLQQIRSVICAPLLVRNELQGLIYIDQGKIAAFSDDDLDVVNAVAAETAIALENVHALARLTREAEARAAYSRFLPAHVVEDLLHRPEALQLGGANQTATILFADIRAFTRLSALYDPEHVVAMLNEYFGAMTEIIFEHGGTLDKYIGDGLMAIFGAPYAGPDDAIHAVAAAVAMQKRMAIMKEQFRAKGEGWQDLDIGIGINTGVVTVGYVGSSRRLDYTAIGDAVNICSRLENHAPPGMTYLSRSTYEGLRGQFECRPLQIKVKGRDVPLDCYELLPG